VLPEIRSLALPGHSFVALDGNPVPNPTTVPVLWIGTAERVSAIVHMTHPGIWILDDLANDDRRRYEDRSGARGSRWKSAVDVSPGFQVELHTFRKHETFEMTFAKDNAAQEGFNRWTINGISCPMTSEAQPAAFHLKQGKRYRLSMRNPSDDIHPIRLHRHRFELTSLAANGTAGILKDVLM